MKTPLKVGDRVRVYCTHGSWDGTVEKIQPMRLKYDDPAMTEMLLVRNPQGVAYSQHPKQCRRLRPKAKAREFWITLGSPIGGKEIYGPTVSDHHFAPQGREVIHVREVRGGRKS